MNWLKIIRLIILFVIIETIAVACVACINGQIVHAKTQRSQPMVIYIDKEFNSEEQTDIYKAMRAWEQVSDNKLFFKPIWNTPKPGVYHKHHDSPRIVFFWKIDKNSNHLSKKLREEYKHTHGLFVPKSKTAAHIIVFAKNITRKHFYQVALHELGHYLGLPHTNKSSRAIMASHVEGNCITNFDAEPLCKIYDCEPKPECIVEKD